jgi:hypothetical protein
LDIVREILMSVFHPIHTTTVELAHYFARRGAPWLSGEPQNRVMDYLSNLRLRDDATPPRNDTHDIVALPYIFHGRNDRIGGPE